MSKKHINIVHCWILGYKSGNGKNNKSLSKKRLQIDRKNKN